MLSGDRKSGLERGEDDEFEHEQDERPELGLGDQAPDERRALVDAASCVA